MDSDTACMTTTGSRSDVDRATIGLWQIIKKAYYMFSSDPQLDCVMFKAYPDTAINYTGLDEKSKYDFDVDPAITYLKKCFHSLSMMPKL